MDYTKRAFGEMSDDTAAVISGLATEILSAADTMSARIAAGQNDALTRAPSLKGFSPDDNDDGWWSYEVIVPWKTDEGLDKATWVRVFSDSPLTPEELQSIAEDEANDIINAYPEKFGLDPNNLPGVISFENIVVDQIYHK